MSTSIKKSKHAGMWGEMPDNASQGENLEMSEMVDHPHHYQMEGGIEVIDYIASVCGTEGCYAFDIGNALKYISRAGRKFNTKEDLRKAIWYLNHAISCINDESSKSEPHN